MRLRHTRRSDKSLAGPTIQRSNRLPKALVDLVLADIDAGIPEIHDFTEATTDALWLWHYENRRMMGAYAKVRAAGGGTLANNVTRSEHLTAMAVNLAPPEDGPASSDVNTPPRPTWNDVDPEIVGE